MRTITKPASRLSTWAFCCQAALNSSEEQNSQEGGVECHSGCKGTPRGELMEYFPCVLVERTGNIKSGEGRGRACASAACSGFPHSFSKWSYFLYVIIKEKQIGKTVVRGSVFPFYG